MDASLADWTTPATRDHKMSKHRDRAKGEQLDGQVQLVGPMRLTADGRLLTGSSAGMESGGQLNPAFSRWLMGYPKAWCEAAIAASRTLKQRKKRG